MKLQIEESDTSSSSSSDEEQQTSWEPKKKRSFSLLKAFSKSEGTENDSLLVESSSEDELAFLPDIPSEVEKNIQKNTDQVSEMRAKSLGSFVEFFWILLFGFSVPFFSVILVFCRSPSFMAKIGVALGTGNSFLWLASVLFSLPFMPESHQFELKEYYNLSPDFGILGAAVSLLVLSLVPFGMAYYSYKKYIISLSSSEYNARASGIAIATKAGSDFTTYLIIGFWLPLIGLGLGFYKNTVTSRYGACVGFSTFLILFGTISIPIPYIFLYNPWLFSGLVILESTYVYFSRMFVSFHLELYR